MPRLSRLFYITAVTGVLMSVMYCYGLLVFVEYRSDSIIARCREGKECAADALHDLSFAVSSAYILGVLLLFWVAYQLGVRWLKTAATRPATDLQQ